MIILVLASLDQSRTSLGPVAIETSCNQSFAVFSPVASKISSPKTSSVQLLPKFGKRLDWTGLLNTNWCHVQIQLLPCHLLAIVHLHCQDHWHTIPAFSSSQLQCLPISFVIAFSCTFSAFTSLFSLYSNWSFVLHWSLKLLKSFQGHYTLVIALLFSSCMLFRSSQDRVWRNKMQTYHTIYLLATKCWYWVFVHSCCVVCHICSDYFSCFLSSFIRWFVAFVLHCFPLFALFV